MFEIIKQKQLQQIYLTLFVEPLDMKKKPYQILIFIYEF